MTWINHIVTKQNIELMGEKQLSFIVPNVNILRKNEKANFFIRNCNNVCINEWFS